jgi:hypothetical protein
MWLHNCHVLGGLNQTKGVEGFIFVRRRYPCCQEGVDLLGLPPIDFRMTQNPTFCIILIIKLLSHHAVFYITIFRLILTSTYVRRINQLKL